MGKVLECGQSYEMQSTYEIVSSKFAMQLKIEIAVEV